MIPVIIAVSYTHLTGGRNFVVQFEQQVEPETVRDLLKKKITEDNVQAIALGTDKKTIRSTTNYLSLIHILL